MPRVPPLIGDSKVLIGEVLPLLLVEVEAFALVSNGGEDLLVVFFELNVLIDSHDVVVPSNVLFGDRLHIVLDAES